MVRWTLSTSRLILGDHEYNCFISTTVSNCITCLAREDHVTSILYHVIAEFTFFGLDSCEFETKHHLRLSDEEIWILNRRVEDYRSHWKHPVFFTPFSPAKNTRSFMAWPITKEIRVSNRAGGIGTDTTGDLFRM